MESESITRLVDDYRRQLLDHNTDIAREIQTQRTSIDELVGAITILQSKCASNPECNTSQTELIIEKMRDNLSRLLANEDALISKSRTLEARLEACDSGSNVTAGLNEIVDIKRKLDNAILKLNNQIPTDRSDIYAEIADMQSSVKQKLADIDAMQCDDVFPQLPVWNDVQRPAFAHRLPVSIRNWDDQHRIEAAADATDEAQAPQMPQIPQIAPAMLATLPTDTPQLFPAAKNVAEAVRKLSETSASEPPETEPEPTETELEPTQTELEVQAKDVPQAIFQPLDAQNRDNTSLIDAATNFKSAFEQLPKTLAPRDETSNGISDETSIPSMPQATPVTPDNGCRTIKDMMQCDGFEGCWWNDHNKEEPCRTSVFDDEVEELSVPYINKIQEIQTAIETSDGQLELSQVNQFIQDINELLPRVPTGELRDKLVEIHAVLVTLQTRLSGL